MDGGRVFEIIGAYSLLGLASWNLMGNDLEGPGR